jgi:transposase
VVSRTRVEEPQLREDGSASTAILRVDAFMLLAVSAHHEGLEQAVHATAVEDFCRGCGVQARLHNRRPAWVRDLPAGGRPVTLVWVMRGAAVAVRAAGCPVATWTETSSAIAPRASLAEPPGPRSAGGSAGRTLGGPGRHRVGCPGPR